MQCVILFLIFGALAVFALPGDTDRIAQHEKHWHGATAITLIAIHEAEYGETVVWLEHVFDEVFGAG